MSAAASPSVTAEAITDDQLREEQDIALIMGDYALAETCSDALGLDRRSRKALTPAEIVRAKRKVAAARNARLRSRRAP